MDDEPEDSNQKRTYCTFCIKYVNGIEAFRYGTPPWEEDNGEEKPKYVPVVNLTDLNLKER